VLRKVRREWSWTAAVAALALPGCVVGPKFQTPAVPAASRFTAAPLPPQTAAADGQAQRFVEGLDIQGQWWALYHSPALDALVAQAIKANPDIEAAQAALRAARETAAAQRGQRLPTVDLGYNVIRQKNSDTIAPPLASNAELYTLHTAQVTVGYVPDVFGGLARQSEAAAAQAEGQRFQTEAAYLTLTANLVSAAIQQASLAEQIEETRTEIAAERRALALMQRQFDLGQIARADLAAQANLVAQAEQTLPPLQKQLAQQGDLIADLAGRTPSEATAQPFALSALTLPRDLPVSLPSKLAAQRPDLRAAEANLHAASAQVGVAIAARLPSFPLSVSAGGASNDLATLFSNGNDFWTLGGAVAQPVFHGGSLLHQQRAAEAVLDQAKAQYRSVALSAFQNVADSLEAIQGDARALQAAQAAEASAADSLAAARRQVEAGEASSLTMITAEQAHQQAMISLTQARAARLADTAALFQALGGGWWNRADTPGAQASAAAGGRE